MSLFSYNTKCLQELLFDTTSVSLTGTYFTVLQRRRGGQQSSKYFRLHLSLLNRTHFTDGHDGAAQGRAQAWDAGVASSLWIHGAFGIP